MIGPRGRRDDADDGGVGEDELEEDLRLVRAFDIARPCGQEVAPARMDQAARTEGPVGDDAYAAFLRQGQRRPWWQQRDWTDRRRGRVIR